MHAVPVITSDHDLPARLRELDDVALVTRIRELTGTERAITIQLLHHLNEIERRKLYLEMGCGSLFAYCTRHLQYSASSACRRIDAARCIRDYPTVLSFLESGELDLGTVCLIRPVLTEENCEEILARVRGRSYRQVKRVAAEYGPVVVAAKDSFEPVRVLASAGEIDALLFDRGLARSVPFPQERHGENWVIAQQKWYVKFLASEDLIKQYEEVVALLSNSHPHASFADVLGVLLNEFIERHSPEARERRREERRVRVAGGRCSTTGAGGRTAAAPSQRRHIPASVRDEVQLRDGGQCAYVASDGTRCEERHYLQIDHVRPYAAGGGNDAANLRLLCPGHNRLAAEKTLGAHVMSHYWRRQ